MMRVVTVVGMMGVMARGPGDRIVVRQSQERRLSGVRDGAGTLRDRRLGPAYTESRIGNRRAGALRQDRG